jgi:tetratricopeptide (TPR) repeat protein
MTAEELLQAAGKDYAAGQWERAAAGFAQFIKDYGSRPEAQPIIPKLRFPLAQCYLQLKKPPEALAAIDAALAVKPPLTPREIQDLTFNKAICLAQQNQPADARPVLESFVAMFPRETWSQPGYAAQFPAVRNVPEAQLLIGTCYVLESKWKDAADYFAKLKPALASIYRGRATVLELYALAQAGELPRGLAVVVAEFPRLEEMIQLATFETLTLELGAQLLDRGEFRQAIVCFSRIWDSRRLVQHQEKRLADLEKALAAMEANPRSDPAQKHLLTQLAGKIRTELAAFKKIPNFDSALRLRLATAYQAMQRYRETALILEGMLNDLPADPIVEQASVSLVQCWGQIERWPKVVEAAQAFAKKFPQSKSVPLVRYLEGTAQQKELRYAEADATFGSLITDFAKDDFAPRGLFMQGFTRLLADQPREALAFFERFQTEYPQHELAESAAYWRAMACSLDKQFDRCRAVVDEYLVRFPHGENRGLAIFRKAYAAHSARNYAVSMPELEAYLREFPGHEANSEALVLLGDALLAGGQIEEGMSAFRRIAATETRFFEEGWFKIGKALKLLERYADLRAHMEKFVRDYPRSNRIGEAIYWVGWVHRQDGKPEEARKLYWETIAKHGNDPAIRSVDDLFPALSKLYKGEEERAQLLAKLRDLREDGDKSGRKTLAMRALWAQARELQRTEPEKARTLFAEASTRASVQTTNPLLLADFAEAFKGEEAIKWWRDLLKWNPRAAQKDRALAALGLGELAAGHEKAALDYFDRFDQETAGSPLLSKVQLARGKLLEDRGDFAGAQKTLEGLLAEKTAPGQDKSEALFRIAELQMRQKKPQLAIPYYQRIYVMYGRWRDVVARAYLRSGEAFEQISDKDAARKTYEEFIANEQFAGLPERQQAEQRLKSL